MEIKVEFEKDVSITKWRESDAAGSMNDMGYYLDTTKLFHQLHLSVLDQLLVELVEIKVLRSRGNKLLKLKRKVREVKTSLIDLEQYADTFTMKEDDENDG